MELPILEMTVEDGQDIGIRCMSFVKNPAIQVGWIAFEEHQVKFAIENEAERIVFGAVLIPDQKIYRKDEKMGEYYVTATKQGIRAIREQFFKSQNTAKVNTEHKGGLVNSFLLESFISDSAKGIANPKPFETLPDGTWFVGYKIEDDQTWSDVQSGKFLGFSLEGNFNLNQINLSEEDILLNEIEALLDSKLNSITN